MALFRKELKDLVGLEGLMDAKEIAERVLSLANIERKFLIDLLLTSSKAWLASKGEGK